MNALQRKKMRENGGIDPPSVSLPAVTPAQLRAMARALEQQKDSDSVVLEEIALELDAGHDPLVLVYGGESCSAFNVSPRTGAELLLLLERAG